MTTKQGREEFLGSDMVELLDQTKPDVHITSGYSTSINQ